MRASIVLVSAAALALTLVDFVVNTRSQLLEQGELREKVRQRQADDIERLKAPEVPPSSRQLARWQDAAEQAAAVAATGEAAWFSGREDAWDYLLDSSVHAGRADAAEIRELLRTRLIYLNSEVTRIESGGAGLGIRFPNASQGLSPEPSILRDQAERATVLSWALDSLDDDRNLESLRMNRDDEGRLEVSLELRAPANAVLEYYEAFLAPSDSIAPRRVLEVRMTPVAPSAWGREIAELESPPVRLQLRVAMENPDLDRGPRVGNGEAGA